MLLRIDPDRHRVEAERAKALKDQAVAELGRAQADLQRRESLAASQLLSTEELTRSRGENARLEAAVEVAKAAYEIALQNQRRAEVRPPITGVINTRTVDTGQFIRTGTVLATIVDVSRLRLRFKVSEGESLRAREGGRVSFGVAPLGPREFGARIYHVGRVADPATRQVEVLAWVDPEHELKPGFFAEVTLDRREEGGRAGGAGERDPGERARLRHLRREGEDGAPAAGRAWACAPAPVSSRSCRVSRRARVVVSEGSDRLADGMPVEPVEPAAEGRAMSGESPRPTPEREDPHQIATGMTLADISIRNHVFAWILMFALIGFGLLTFTGFGTVFKGLGISQNPDVDFPVVNVSVTWEGASPEIIETDVVDILEEAVTSVEGVKEVSSTSRQGAANITRRVRARARHRRRDAGRPEQDLAGAEPAAARHRPADRQQVEPRGRADHAARARGQPPAHLRRRLHPQRDPAAAPDDPGHRRDPAAGLPRQRACASGTTRCGSRPRA